MEINLTWANAIVFILAAAGAISTICGAGAWIVKIVKGIKKPAENTKDRFEDIDGKLDADSKRIKQLEEDIDYIKKTQSQLLKVCLVILDELKKNNDVDGVIAKTEDNIQDFLIERE